MFTLSKIISENGIFIDGDWIESKDQNPNGEVRLIQLADIGDGNFLNKSDRYLTYDKAVQLKCTFLKKGDILIARMPDPLGRACIFPGDDKPCVTAVDVCIVRPASRSLSNEYLKYLINNKWFRNKIYTYSSGTTRKRISRKNLDKISFVLPQLEDQIRIASLLSRIEELIAKRKESIRLLDEFVKSTFLEMFGDPVRNEKGWERKKLGEQIDDIIAGSSYGGEDKDFIDEDELGVIKISAVTLGIFNPKEFKAVKKHLITKTIINPLKGDLLFSRANTRELVGATCIVDEDYTNLFLPDKIWKIMLNEQFMNKYYLHYLLLVEKFKETLRNNATGTSGSMLNISMDKLRNLLCPIPPIELQNKFRITIIKIKQNIVKFQDSLSELEKLYGVVSQRAFRGEE